MGTFMDGWIYYGIDGCGLLSGVLARRHVTFYSESQLYGLLLVLVKLS